MHKNAIKCVFLPLNVSIRLILGYFINVAFRRVSRALNGNIFYFFNSYFELSQGKFISFLYLPYFKLIPKKNDTNKIYIRYSWNDRR